MLRLLFLLPAVLAACPSGAVYNSQFNRCYFFQTSLQGFILADQACGTLGGHLASVQNAFENGLISETATSQFGSSRSYWIGANTLMSTQWSWIDGTPFTYSNFQQQSSNSSTPQCGYVSGNGVWVKGDCTTSLRSVCVIPGEQPTSPPPTCPPSSDICPNGWAYYNVTDFCYRTLLGDTFANAEDICQSSGAHLVSIHSSQENEFVVDLAAAGFDLDYDDQTFIGLHKVNNQWAYTDGTTVDYYNWAPGQPDNSGGHESCVQIFADQLSGKGHTDYHTKWNDISCETRMRAFVCKKRASH